MAKQTAPKTVSEDVGCSHEVLRETALKIYTESGINNSSYDPSYRAKRSFALAAEFLREDQRILNGGDVGPVNEARKAPMVMVEKWNPITNEPVINPESGEIVTYEIRGDIDSYAPNLDARHPINQVNYKARAILGMDPIDKKLAQAQSDFARTLKPSRN